MSQEGEQFNWSRIFEFWGLVEADFASEYHADLEACGHRSWRWFRVRLFGLLLKDGTRLAQAWNPPKQQFQDADPETEFS